MKLLISTLLLLTAFSHLKAQKDLPCGTQLSQKQIEAMNERKRTRPVSARLQAEEVSNVAITAHVLRTSEGTGGLSQANLEDAIETVNSFYANANLSFFILGDINYIDDDQYYDFDADDETDLTTENNVANTINIYFANSVTFDESALCGYAYFSASNKDVVVMDNGCTTNGSTLPHEIGHYFDLYHTHGTTNNGTTDELVDGSNCSDAGDRICDTPADPNLSGVVDNSVDCNYIGTATDANDDEYTPDTGNIMSYSLKGCRTHFSDGQYDEIADTYANDRNYLISKSLAADFTSDLTTICSGASIIYTDESISANSWSWEFPGGTPATSTEQNPEVTYETSGTYNVTLTITNDAEDEDVKTFTNYITVEDAAVNPPDELSFGFESEESELYSIRNDDEDNTFEISSVALSGDQSLLMDFLTYERIGEEDYLILDEIELSEGKTYRLSFSRAYAYYDDSYQDSLAIMIAEPCTYNWELFYGYSPDDLATTNPHTGTFVPTSDEWEEDQHLIVFDESWDGAQVAFKAVNGYGNNLYLDQISLEIFETDFELDDIILGCASDDSASDGTAEIIASGSGTMTYSLDGSNFQQATTFSSLKAGEYTLYVRQDNELVSQQTFTLNSAEGIEISISTNQNGDLVAVSELNELQWFYNGEAVDDANSNTLAFQGGGIYYVEATNESGCTAKSNEFTVLDLPTTSSTMKIYPNPVASLLQLELPDAGLVRYEIINMAGKALLIGQLSSSGQHQVDVSILNTGIYVLQISTEEGTFQERFRKE